MKRSTILVLLLFALAAPAARADGLPVLGVDVGPTGVASLAGHARYLTLSAGRNTMLERVDARNGHVLVWSLLRGSWTIPAVAYDYSASGLSADGKRLVLIEPRAGFPRARTRLLVLDTSRLWLKPVRTIDLNGDFSFDALSPRGRLMYLIHYTSPTDPTVYEVRRVDLSTGALAAKAVTDPEEHGVKMGGRPLERVESRDGRWAYTLYDGNGSPFVHALDTSTSSAHCIDLAMLKHRQYWMMSLRLDRSGRELLLVRKQVPQVAIDLRTFTTAEPAPPAGAKPTGGGFPWTLVVLLVGGLAAAATLVFVVRRRPYSSPSKSSASELMQ
jgi:hypothetical protein